MNKRPVSYLQTDPRWKDRPYRVRGESSTIGSAGCGPTCAAMLIRTLTGKGVTPVDTCAWSMEHGYKAKGQGTYYGYFKPQFAAYGVRADRINTASLYGKPRDPAHGKALAMLKEGYYLIACMGKGLWTSSGHFVVVWWEDGKVRINDPVSTKAERLNGDLETFKSQVKYYWWVDARQYNEENEDMTDEKFDELMQRWLRAQNEKGADDWAKPHIEAAKAAGITDGSRPKGIPTRQEVIVMCRNAAAQGRSEGEG